MALLSLGLTFRPFCSSSVGNWLTNKPTWLFLCRAFLNPGAGKRRSGISSSPWAAQEGQDFLANHIVPSIDLITTHIWSDNWMG